WICRPPHPRVKEPTRGASGGVRPGSGAATSQVLERGRGLVPGRFDAGDGRLDPLEQPAKVRLLVGGRGHPGSDPLPQVELAQSALDESQIDPVELVRDRLESVAHDGWSMPTTEEAHAS